MRLAIASTAHPPGDQRISQWRRSFSEAGWDVEVHCAQASGHVARVRAAVAMAAQLRRGGFDAVVLVDPELIALGPVLQMVRSRIRPCKLVADVHEDFRGVAGDHQAWSGRSRERVGSFTGAAVQAAAAQLDATVVADLHVPPTAARWRLVGRNLPDRELLERVVGRPDTTAPAAGTTRRAVYAGDLTRQRGVLAMVEGVTACEAWTLDLYGPGRPWAMEVIAEAERASGGRVTWRGHLAHEDLLTKLGDYDVGLCILDAIPTYAAALPSKITEYQAAGLAIVSSDLPRAAAAVRSSEGGIVLNGPSVSADHLATALDELASGDMRAMGERNRKAFEALDLSDSLAVAASTIAYAWERQDHVS